MSANTAISKLAALLPSVQLQPHQKRVLEESAAEPQRKLLVWGLGSGKSLGALAAAEGYGKPYTAIVPASLRNNIRGEIDKFTDKTIPSDVLSYTALAKGDPVNLLGTLVLDEAQRLRSEDSAASRRAMELADQADQVIMLSGTPIVNHPRDLTVPINMLTGYQLTGDQFDKHFLQEKVVRPPWSASGSVEPTKIQVMKNREALKAMLEGKVDYYSPDKPPVGVTQEDIKVMMSPEQSQVYRRMWGDLPYNLRWKMENDFPMSDAEAAMARHFLAGPRQVGLSTLPYRRDKDALKAFDQSGKLKEAFRNLQSKFQDPRTKALVFSNFINAGLSPYHAALQRANIPAAVFHGGLTDKQRKALVDDYNANKIRVALLGPSGAEGLSFKGTQLIQILDPHWNAARTQQAQGRGVRHDSHWGLPEDLQNVHIQRYESRLPPGYMKRMLAWLLRRKLEGGDAVDQVLLRMSAKKNELNNQFLDLLKEIGSRRKQQGDVK